MKIIHKFNPKSIKVCANCAKAVTATNWSRHWKEQHPRVEAKGLEEGEPFESWC
jgi:hypothetical protein